MTFTGSSRSWNRLELQNGARNLVKAVGLSERQETALVEASDNGSKGLLIAKHPDPSACKSKLILVADIDDEQLLERLVLLNDHDVRLVEAAELPSFGDESEPRRRTSIDARLAMRAWAQDHGHQHRQLFEVFE